MRRVVTGIGGSDMEPCISDGQNTRIPIDNFEAMQVTRDHL